MEEMTDREKLHALAQFVNDRWAEISRSEGYIKTLPESELATRAGLVPGTVNKVTKERGMWGDDTLWQMHQVLGTDSRGRNVYTILGRMEPIPNDKFAVELMRRIWPKLEKRDQESLLEVARDMAEQNKASESNGEELALETAAG
jgi:hypothetical protein